VRKKGRLLIECESKKFGNAVEDEWRALMPIPKELLDILVCPICKTPVKFTPDSKGLKCETCKRVYPVRDEIPVMLVEEAKIEQGE
jgi:uncharacterized protein